MFQLFFRQGPRDLSNSFHLFFSLPQDMFLQVLAEATQLLWVECFPRSADQFGADFRAGVLRQLREWFGQPPSAQGQSAFWFILASLRAILSRNFAFTLLRARMLLVGPLPYGLPRLGGCCLGGGE